MTTKRFCDYCGQEERQAEPLGAGAIVTLECEWQPSHGLAKALSIDLHRSCVERIKTGQDIPYQLVEGLSVEPPPTQEPEPAEHATRQAETRSIPEPPAGGRPVSSIDTSDDPDPEQ